MIELVSKSTLLEGNGGEEEQRKDEDFTGIRYRLATKNLGSRADLFHEAFQRVFGKLGKKAEYYKDFAQIAAFLSTSKPFVDVFKQLDDDFRKVLSGKGMEVSNRLTSSFYDLFESYGCYFPRVHNIVLVGSSFKVFGPIVSGGFLFKDGTGPHHGEYTHTLQWLAVAKAQKLGILELEHSVFDLYCNSAGGGTLSKLKLLRGDDLSVGQAAIWQFLVDCFPETGEHKEHLLSNLMSNSYRTPSHLMRSLFSGPLRQTVFARYLFRRYEKRNEAFENAEGMRNYHLTKQKSKGSLYSTQEGVNVTIPSLFRGGVGKLVESLVNERKVKFEQG